MVAVLAGRAPPGGTGADRSRAGSGARCSTSRRGAAAPARPSARTHDGSACATGMGQGATGALQSFGASRAPAQSRPRASDKGSGGEGTDGLGVVIVDHGSRRAESNRSLEKFVEMYRNLTHRAVVEVAHMELASPTIADAVGKCAEAGCTRVVVAPYFLSHGRHIQDDIPALVEAAQEAHPHLRCTIAEPIGLDPLMAQLIDNRVQAALLASSPHSMPMAMSQS